MVWSSKDSLDAAKAKGSHSDKMIEMNSFLKHWNFIFFACSQYSNTYGEIMNFNKKVAFGTGHILP